MTPIKAIQKTKLSAAMMMVCAFLLPGLARAQGSSKPDDSAQAQEHFKRGNALSGKRDAAGAVKEYREAIHLKPDYAEAHNGLCDVLPELGGPNLDAAIPECEEALRLKPNYPEAHKNLADVYQEKTEFDKAIAEYREAIRLKPDYAEGHARLGVALEGKGDWDGVITE